MNLRKKIKRWIYSYVPGFVGAFPYFGTQVFFSKNSAAFHEACRQGIYEEDNLNLICSLMQSNSYYFDVGINIGLMSVPVLQRCPSCQVISFEPSPNTLPYLLKTHQNSTFKDRWKIVNKAANDHEGILNFYTATANSSLFDGLKDTQRAGARTQTTIEATTIDREWKAMHSPPVSVIKVDIEGAELQALEGGLECIKCVRPYIVMEWNATNLRTFGLAPECLLTFVQHIDYQILSLPQLILVSNEQLLNLHMTRTESFLLIPCDKV